MHKEHRMSISLPPKGNDAKVLGAYFSPLKVQAQAIPAMKVSFLTTSANIAANASKNLINGEFTNLFIVSNIFFITYYLVLLSHLALTPLRS